MNRRPSGSSALASCLAIGRWTRPWKSRPTSMPAPCAASTRATTSSNAFGVPIQSSSAVAFILTAEKPWARRAAAASPISSRAVAADPGIGADLVAHPAAHHLPGRAGRAPCPSGPTRPARGRPAPTSGPARRGRSRRDSRSGRRPRSGTGRGRGSGRGAPRRRRRPPRHGPRGSPRPSRPRLRPPRPGRTASAAGRRRSRSCAIFIKLSPG